MAALGGKLGDLTPKKADSRIEEETMLGYGGYKHGFQLQVEVNVSACNAAITGCEKSRLWQKALHLFIQIYQMKLEPKPGEELIMLITEVLLTSMNWAPSSEAFFSMSEDAFI